MGNYVISFKKSAIKELHKLPIKEILRITELISSLSFQLDQLSVKSSKDTIIYGESDLVIIELYIL